MRTAGIVAFGFGTPATISSNKRIACIASQKARDLNTSVYTQLDVRVEFGIEVNYTDEKPGNPPPTLRMARGAIQWAKQKGFRELWIVAARPHLWRAFRDIEKAICEAGVKIDVLVCEDVYEYSEDSWFCPDSTQERARSREAWDKREKILKLMPFFVYKWVAR